MSVAVVEDVAEQWRTAGVRRRGPRELNRSITGGERREVSRCTRDHRRRGRHDRIGTERVRGDRGDTERTRHPVREAVDDVGRGRRSGVRGQCRPRGAVVGALLDPVSDDRLNSRTVGSERRGRPGQRELGTRRRRGGEIRGCERRAPHERIGGHAPRSRAERGDRTDTDRDARVRGQPRENVRKCS